MQLQKSVGPQVQQSDNIWQVVDLAASRVPQWVFVIPPQAKELHMKTEHGDVVVVHEVTD